MSRARAILLCALLALLLSPGAARAEEPAKLPHEDEFAIGEQGHRFRVRFDPASRIRLGFAEALSLGSASGQGPVAQAPELVAGLGYRTLRARGAGRDRIVWQTDHRILSGWVHPFTQGTRPLPAFDAILYGVTAMRHDESPSVVIPASPPIGVPFPFDIGFESEVGRVVVSDRFPLATMGGAPVPTARIGVMRAAMLLDPWRSGEVGRTFEIGIGARYDIDAYALTALSTPRVIHRVAPMTAASLRFRYQTDDGLLSFDVRGDVIPHWTSEGLWRVAALGSARVERIILAVNDQPIAAVLDGGWRLTPPTMSTDLVNDVRVTLGLSLDLWPR